MRRLALLLAALAALATTASPAFSSELFARNATHVKLLVKKGKNALVKYKVDGVKHRVLVSGAIDALVPSPDVKQVKFKLDYTGGGRKVLKHYKDHCKPYDGPPLAFLVVACKAKDGSYWAVQKWQYWLPFFGYSPWLDYQSDWAFHISHWRASIAQLELWSDWISTKQGATAPHDVFGRLTYASSPVYGYVVKPGGVPGDGYGRVVYIDTYDSKLGAGWWRLTGILARNPSGMFCHAMVPTPTYPKYPDPHVVDPGNGSRYRAYVEGPGATPAVQAEVVDPGDWNDADPAKVERLQQGDALLQRWSSPPACLKYR